MTAGESLRQLLTGGAKELGTPLSDVRIDSCLLYLSELKKWNRKINLTAIRDDQEAIIKHFLDSLSFIKGFAPKPGLRLLDLGSGAGFPALPIKIAFPEMAVTLVESVKKKASFLRHIIRTLGLEHAVVIDQRTDEIPESHHGGYDVVTARAFAGMTAALTEGARFLKPGGLMVLSRGPEETIGDQEADKAGVALEQRVELTLPHSDYKRAIWVFRRAG